MSASIVGSCSTVSGEWLMARYLRRTAWKIIGNGSESSMELFRAVIAIRESNAVYRYI